MTQLVKRGSSLQEKLALHSKCNEQNGCIEWTASTRRGGYGRLSHFGRAYVAHRVSYEVHKGAIPPGMLVCHRCDNPKCINPEHLFLGTYSDNVQDMLQKGRDNCAPGVAVLQKIRKYGEESHRATTTNDVVLQIRRLYAQGVGIQELLAKFPMKRRTLESIVYRQRWRSIGETR